MVSDLVRTPGVIRAGEREAGQDAPPRPADAVEASVGPGDRVLRRRRVAQWEDGAVAAERAESVRQRLGHAGRHRDRAKPAAAGFQSARGRGVDQFQAHGGSSLEALAGGAIHEAAGNGAAFDGGWSATSCAAAGTGPLPAIRPRVHFANM